MRSEHLKKEIRMLAFIWWMLIGLVTGGLARMSIPSRQPMGLLLTMVLGLIGPVVGGFISSVIFNYGPRDQNFHFGGLILSTIGAVILLGIYAWSVRRIGSA